MKITKKVTNYGTVVLPKTLRSALGISLGTAVDVETDGEYIIISKHVPVCRFCGSPENIFQVFDTEICTKCAKIISRKAGIKNG